MFHQGVSGAADSQTHTLETSTKPTQADKRMRLHLSSSHTATAAWGADRNNAEAGGGGEPELSRSLGRDGKAA